MENIERYQATQSVESIAQSVANLAEDLRITPDDIKGDYINHPAKFAYWAVVAAQARAALDKKKLEVDRQDEFIKKTLLGKLDKRVRDELDDAGIRITEAKVTAGIYSHARYLAAMEELHTLQGEYLELQRQYNLLSAAKDAMVHRKDMLVSLGAQLRQEGGE